MPLPGFTADASIGPLTKTYRGQGYYNISTTDPLSPQQLLAGDDLGVMDDSQETDEDIETGEDSADVDVDVDADDGTEIGQEM